LLLITYFLQVFILHVFKSMPHDDSSMSRNM